MILLLEDDAVTRCVVADLLRDAGHEVFDTSDPYEALRVPDPPIVLITDIELGSALNGIDVAAKAHRQWPKVRVILMTAHADVQPAWRLDPRDRLVEKPFSARALLEAVHYLRPAILTLAITDLSC